MMFGYQNPSPWPMIGQFTTWAWLIFPLVMLDIILKGFALWKAARNNQVYWFIALLLVNSLGILPAIYLAFAAKKK